MGPIVTSESPDVLQLALVLEHGQERPVAGASLGGVRCGGPVGRVVVELVRQKGVGRGVVRW